MQGFWDFISNRLLKDDMSGLDRIKAKILNQYAFILSLFFLFDSFRDFYEGFYAIGTVLFLIAITILALFIFTKIPITSFLVFISIIICILLIFIFSSSKGFENGLSFYYFAVLLSSVFLFNERKNYHYGLAVFLFIVFFFTIGHCHEFNLFSFEIAHGEQIDKNMRLYTFVQVVLFMGFNASFLYRKNNAILTLLDQNERKSLLINQLHQKINQDSPHQHLENLVKQAMDDNLLFIPTFKQVFPHLYDRLCEQKPDFTQDEFKLIAYIKLGFTTKDIARCTNITVRSVQTKKHRLRKSFAIEPDQDLYLWVDSL
ncbi:diguanylate cyclase [Sphingobacterium sp. DK4209]|uniref:Diguanylate cyclase n=1 Tax=Sphingobacterium zhuxiongii TaxID=2662364 RepID=A0A5Q0QBB9_9SPHI|nr:MULTISPECIES: diguanylate cyclase [unclassified Sphingobacterium]MVZ66145.1 diguanylate cyclase [Sphingobacterium sp. DK4209]QGA26564.1 diguanylate cyclase [Sphingobacterium sp. dk4302]